MGHAWLTRVPASPVAMDEAVRGRKLGAAEREQLRARLAQEKYQRLLQELLAELRKRSTVRVLDPLDNGVDRAVAQPPVPRKAG